MAVSHLPTSKEIEEPLLTLVSDGKEHRYKAKDMVSGVHARIANIRNDAHHKATTDIVRRASAIGVETLMVSNLLKNRNIAKAHSDAALGGFLVKLTCFFFG